MPFSIVSNAAPHASSDPKSTDGFVIKTRSFQTPCHRRATDETRCPPQLPQHTL